jgi:hypothetical protein
VKQSADPRAGQDCDTTEGEDGRAYFGDKMEPMDGKHIRISTINVNNLLHNVEGDERLFREIHARDIQILCMQEVGCNWTNIRKVHSFQNRVRNTFGPYEIRTRFHHNVHDLAGTTRQWGAPGFLAKARLNISQRRQEGTHQDWDGGHGLGYKARVV